MPPCLARWIEVGVHVSQAGLELSIITEYNLELLILLLASPACWDINVSLPWVCRWNTFMSKVCKVGLQMMMYMSSEFLACALPTSIVAI